MLMGDRMKKICLLIICLFLIPISVKAEGLNFKMNETVNEEIEVQGSSIILGNNVDSGNTVIGIDALFGNNVTFSGESDYGLFFGNNVNVKGTIKNDGFVFGNIIKFDEDAVVNRDLVVFGSEVTIDGKINRDVKIYASSVTINGEILGDVEVKANAITVSGNIKGVLSYNNDAEINISGTVSKTKLTDPIAVELTLQDKIWQFIVNYGSTLVIFLVLALIVPQLFKRIENKNKDITVLNFFSLFGFGTLSLILIPVIFLLLFSFVFGISLAILLLILYIVAIWLSSIFTSYLIGYLIWNKILKKENNNMYLIGLIGISLINVLNLIPSIGTLITIICIMIGMGIILQQFKKDN